MSSVNQTGCLNLTWQIDNFNLFWSTKGKREVCCPVLRTDTNDGSDLFHISLIIYQDSSSAITLSRHNEWHTLDKCEISLKNTTKEVSLNCQNLSKSKFCEIGDETIFSEESVPSEACITICCKLWLQFQKPEDRIIRTILHKDSLFWNIKTGLSSQKTLFLKDNLLLGLTLANGYFHIFLVPSKDVCSSFVHCKLSMRADQGDIGPSKCDWPFVKWATAVTCKENASSSVELQLDYIVGVHSFSSALRKDFLQLYKEKLYSDATLNAAGKSFSAHRGILAARLPVFRAMFERDEMSKGRTGVVDIDDVDSATVDRMLVFLYSNSLEGVQWEEASALYYAADKYDVLPLKQECANILKADLSADNVCDILVLADKHSDEPLMKCVMGFLRDHVEVISSGRWEELEDSNPKLTSKITREVLLNKFKQDRKVEMNTN